jgi:putative transposase
MLISLAYRLGALATVAQRDASKDAEALVLQHENAILRRHVQKVCYQPEDRLWSAALSRLIPRRRWAEVFPVTPGTAPAWHRKLATDKHTPTPTRPGRPRTVVPVKAMVIRTATEDPTWRHRRVHGK